MSYANRFMTTNERFDAKVDRSGGPDACWPWIAGCYDSGYGAFWDGGKTTGAHIFALRRDGRLPVGLWTLHSCDNPACCNPQHLFAGTPKDNTLDMFAKGRANPPRGESSAQCKLSDAQVAAIRAALANGARQDALAVRYGVTQSLISQIKTMTVRRENTRKAAA